ncbi:CHASE2 domain-containing protein [Syntrophobacter fumaroxidans]|uniref:Adenylate/guanylate cyclase n=1 Tax=Syntrophobacter fumaroxidans (strain DSM 10017 / MPOB) TaxID=335543 RepID=A0LKW1_SYNFM|nr:adenylate/guanylate cyclase domain-containing protein [Syntrophobacter fumaroxidans]ABK18063.1 adenylate/guanylate cyclase [Syntrophobacter fumaroxidans MPOB]
MGRKLIEGGLAGAGAAMVALLFWAVGFFDLWEFATWSWRVDFFAAPSAQTEKIKLILLDQNSLAWGKKEKGWPWPWPREVYTTVIDFCNRGGAKAVVFDMIFSESSFFGVDDDRALAAAIDRAPAFVMPFSVGRQVGEADAWPPEIPRRCPIRISNLAEWLASAPSRGAVMPKASFPVPEVCSGSAVLGNVIQEPDADGVFRRCHLFHFFDGLAVPSLSLAAYLAGQGLCPPVSPAPTTVGGQTAAPTPSSGPVTVRPQPADEALHSSGTLPLEEITVRDGCCRIGERCIPIDTRGRAILRFRGPVGTYRSFSAAAVIESELRLREGGEPIIRDPGVLRDCTVFLGASAPALLDLRPTPISRVSPGVELHATVLDNLLSDDFLSEAPAWFCILSTLFLSMLGSLLVVSGKTARHSTMAAAAVLPLPVAAGFLAYGLGYWWPIVVHESAVALSLALGISINYAHEWKRRAFIKKAFKYYLSPAVVEKILADPSRLVLGGERRELSIFFSDLQGFSSISERLDPPALTSLLNEYLSDMTDIILEEEGTLDKYEGDAVIAFWNAPVDQPDHALRACRAAIRCQHRLDERREEFRRKTGELLYQRIGINTGSVVVGNMGSGKRFDYTVLGDAANLASRLEGANKVFGTYTMVSEDTWTQVGGELLGREIGLLRVVGRKNPVRVYEVIGFASTAENDGLNAFASALALYYAGGLSAALEAFRMLSDDPVARVYAARCESLLREDEASRDIVWNLKEK